MKKLNLFLKFFFLPLFFISNTHFLLAQPECNRGFVVTVSYDDFDACPTEICLMEVVPNGTGDLVNVSNVLAIDWSVEGEPIELLPFESDCLGEETLQDFQGEIFTVTVTYFVPSNMGVLLECTETLTYIMDCDPGCEDIGSAFNLDGSFDNWQVFTNSDGDDGAGRILIEQSANTLDGTPFMQVTDNTSVPRSWVFNEVDFVGINCGTLCYDLNITEDKQGDNEFTNPRVILYSGNAVWDNTNDIIAGTTIQATFTSDIQMNDNSGPAIICTEIFEATNTLPPGWEITGGDNVPANPINAWNTLLADVTGLALIPEVVDIRGEVFNYDNICFMPCPNPCNDRAFVVEPIFDVEGCLDVLCLREDIGGSTISANVWPIEWSLLDGTILSTAGGCISDESTFEGQTVVVTFNYDGNGDGANECEETILFDAPTCSPTIECDDEYQIVLDPDSFDANGCPQGLAIWQVLDNGEFETGVDLQSVEWSSSIMPIEGITAPNDNYLTQLDNSIQDHQGGTFTAIITYNNGECRDTLTFEMPFCNPRCNGTDFNDGTVMNWQAFINNDNILGAHVVNLQDANNNFDGTPFLEVTDNTGTSVIFNEQNFAGLNDGMLCFDIEVTSGLGGTYTPNIRIYSGVMPDGIILEATFTANFTMNQNSGPVNLCAPIVAANASLPQGTQGTWSITAGTGNDIVDWNNLIANNDGIALNPDFVFGRGEVTRYDNFCFTPCSDPNANCPREPSCNCNNLTNNCLTLAVEGPPQGCETLSANINPGCLPSDACLDHIDWRVRLGAIDLEFFNQGAGITWEIPATGFFGFNLVVTASIHLTDGQVCEELGNQVTLECGSKGGGDIGKRRSMDTTNPLSEKIRLFPNPAQSEISIYNPFDKLVVAKIYDTNGKQFVSTVLSPNSTSRLELNDFSNGVYFVHFIDQDSNENLSTEKLILVE